MTKDLSGNQKLDLLGDPIHLNNGGGVFGIAASLIGSVASTTDNKEINTKLAVIVSSNLAYGLVKMYEALRAYSNNSTKTIRAFKKESDAYEWVQK